MVRETPAEQIQRLLRVGDAFGAMRAADEMLAKLPSSPVARLGRCQAHLMMGKFAEAESDLEIVMRVSPTDELANYFRGKLDILAGRVDEGITRLRPIALGRSPCAVEAMHALLDICFNSAHRDQFRELAQTQGAWRSDPRSILHTARLAALDDPLRGAEELIAILRSRAPQELRRHAGFEAAGLLDRAGEYRKAFETARETHAATGGDFDLDLHTKPILEQIARLERGGNWITPSVARVKGVALLSSLPRSGSTLLEQMLDRHPAISGIGEYEGLARIYQELKSQPAWPRRPESLPKDFCAGLQRLYLDGTKRLRREGTDWTFDKTIRTWRSLPEVAALLPGAVCIAVRRDARDMATSLFLSYFGSDQIGWTGSFASIRRIIELERKLIPRALEVLDIEHEFIQYESLVDDPAREAGKCLARLGLAMDERVLAPERSARVAVTLSAMQVLKPINRSSIGRWKNYAFAFDSSWDGLE